MVDRIVHRKDFRREIADLLSFLWKDGEHHRIGSASVEDDDAEEQLPVEPPRV